MPKNRYKTVTTSTKVEIVTLPENYTIIDGVIYDTNTGLRWGCIHQCSGGKDWAYCNLFDENECPFCEHVALFSSKKKGRHWKPNC